MSLESLFPGLGSASHTVTSPATRQYNCLAWAAAETGAWWEPDPDGDCHWPADVPRERTLEALTQLYERLGYTPCPDDSFEAGFEKVALFAKDGQPTHAARQLPNGQWTSKLGALEDIEHPLHALEGEWYGSVVLLLKRPIANAP